MNRENQWMILLELIIIFSILAILTGSYLHNNRTSITTGKNSTKAINTSYPPGNTSSNPGGNDKCNPHTCSDIPTYNTSVNLTSACLFLENQELDNTGLLVASNGSGETDSRTIYIQHDNYLAWKALEICGSSLASKVEANLANYDALDDPRYKVLFGEKYSFNTPPNNLPVKILGYIKHGNTTYRIALDRLNTSSPLVGWTNYADWVSLMGINYIWSNNLERAQDLYTRLIEMWDTHGFRDNSYRNSYDTYKVALAVYFTRLLDSCGLKTINYTLLNKWLRTLESLQASDGGFYTKYTYGNKTLLPAGSENVETTSLVIISLYYQPGLRG